MNDIFIIKNAKNPLNEHLLEIFKKYYNFTYANYFKSEKSATENYYKLLAIKKTIQIIASFSKHIISGEQLQNIKGIE